MTPHAIGPQLATNLNAASANLAAAHKRHDAAQRSLEQVEAEVIAHRAAYADARERALTTIDPDVRVAAVEELNRLVEQAHELEQRRQRARSELGTARAEVERLTAQVADAHARLERAIDQAVAS